MIRVMRFHIHRWHTVREVRYAANHGMGTAAAPELFALDARRTVKRLCLDCAAVISTRQGSRCVACQGAMNARLQAKKNAQLGGSGGRWQTIRKQVAERQEGRCARCGSEFGSFFEVDHIRPRATGGSSELGNLQALDRACHLAVTRERKERARAMRAER